MVNRRKCGGGLLPFFHRIYGLECPPAYGLCSKTSMASIVFKRTRGRSGHR